MSTLRRRIVSATTYCSSHQFSPLSSIPTIAVRSHSYIYTFNQSRILDGRQIKNHKFQDQRRCLHHGIQAPPPPAPTPFVPDTTTFLTLIGRGLSAHAEKIPSWEALFDLTSPQLKALGVEPARSRKYLLRWREKFRKGEWGIGGDLSVVERNVSSSTDEGTASSSSSELGQAVIRLVDVPNETIAGFKSTKPSKRPASVLHSPNTTKRIINVASTSPVALASSLSLPTDEARQAAEEAVREMKDSTIRHMHVHASSRLRGPHLELLKGTNGAAAVLKVREGLWEQRRGQKLDGGERRRAEVRAKRKSAERKAQA